MANERAGDLSSYNDYYNSLALMVELAATGEYAHHNTKRSIVSGRTSGNKSALFAACFQARMTNNGSKKVEAYKDLARYIIDFREFEKIKNLLLIN